MAAGRRELAGRAAPPSAEGPGVDQRGLPRPVDASGSVEARCDIGSVELAPEPAGAALTIVSLLALAMRRRRGAQRQSVR